LSSSSSSSSSSWGGDGGVSAEGSACVVYTPRPFQLQLESSAFLRLTHHSALARAVDGWTLPTSHTQQLLWARSLDAHRSEPHGGVLRCGRRQVRPTVKAVGGFCPRHCGVF
jgi:hypothetical protein